MNLQKDRAANMVRCYDDFIETLLNAGFTMAGGNPDGIYAIVDWVWNQLPPYETPVSWYSGCPETDPNEWLGRILNDHDDITYGKIFMRKSGYVTNEWLPYFLAVRRNGITFDEAYESGTISHFAKRVYDIVVDSDTVQVEDIKRLGGFSREEKSSFDRALVELQMKMFIMPCTRRHKISKVGELYGMASTVFSTTENLWGQEMFNQAANITPAQAKEKISAQVLKLNPRAEEKKILKFIS